MRTYHSIHAHTIFGREELHELALDQKQRSMNNRHRLARDFFRVVSTGRPINVWVTAAGAPPRGRLFLLHQSSHGTMAMRARITRNNAPRAGHMLL